MATKKKPVDWPKIKARYLKGEKPKSIAAYYEGMTSTAITKRANKEGWKEEKGRIRDKVVQKVENDFDRINKRLLKEYEKLALSDMNRIASWNQSGVDLKDSSELSADDSACVMSITEVTNNQGTSVKIKLHPKLGAMDSLAEITGLKGKKEKEKDTGSSAQSEHVATIKNSLAAIWGKDGA